MAQHELGACSQVDAANGGDHQVLHGLHFFFCILCIEVSFWLRSLLKRWIKGLVLFPAIQHCQFWGINLTASDPCDTLMI